MALRHGLFQLAATLWPSVRVPDTAGPGVKASFSPSVVVLAQLPAFGASRKPCLGSFRSGGPPASDPDRAFGTWCMFQGRALFPVNVQPVPFADRAYGVSIPRWGRASLAPRRACAA